MDCGVEFPRWRMRTCRMKKKFRWVQFGLRSLLTVTLRMAVSFAVNRWYRGATVISHKQTFDGLQDVIVVPDEDKLDFNADFTIEAYVRLPDRQSSMKWTSCIVGKGTGVWNTNKNYFLGILNRSNQVEFHIGDAQGGYQDVFSNQTIIAGQWTHVAAVRSEDALLIYINGVLDTKESPRYIDQASNDEPLLIGGADNSNATFFLTADIDDVRLWSYARDADQIRRDWQRNVNRTTPGLVLKSKANRVQ